MQSPNTAIDPSPSNFAEVMASLAEAQRQQQRAWLEVVEDDVRTIRYERALEMRARYRPTDPGAWTRTEQGSVSRAGAQGPEAVFKPGNASEMGALRAPAEWEADEEPHSAQERISRLEPARKSASVTLRMSDAECEQLQQRAAEAGLTVSAYLRSCAFEVEALRAQVKETLAQLRAAQHPRRTWWLRVLRLRIAGLLL